MNQADELDHARFAGPADEGGAQPPSPVPPKACYAAGSMFWLTRKRFSGS